MSTEPSALQDSVGRFVRAFGLHQPDVTPCGRPIPVSEAHALAELARVDDLRQAELTHRLRLEKSTVSRLVGQLVERGWVERSRAADDGRGVLLRLTPEGRRAADTLADARRERFAALLERIPREQRDDVLRALAVLTEAADET